MIDHRHTCPFVLDVVRALCATTCGFAVCTGKRVNRFLTLKTLPARACTHWSDSAYCGSQTATRQYLPGWRCPAHTPARVRMEATRG